MGLFSRLLSDKIKAARMIREADREAFDWIWEHELSDEEKEKVISGEWASLHKTYKDLGR